MIIDLSFVVADDWKMINLQNNKPWNNLRRDYVTGLRNYPQNCATPPEYNRLFSVVSVPRLSDTRKYADNNSGISIFELEKNRRTKVYRCIMETKTLNFFLKEQVFPRCTTQPPIYRQHNILIMIITNKHVLLFLRRLNYTHIWYKVKFSYHTLRHIENNT